MLAKREKSLGTENKFYRQEGEYIIIIAEGKEHRMATVKESISTVKSGS